MKKDNLAIVKWAGGKRQLLPQLDPLFPKKFNNYHEPFVGAGSVLFHLMKTKDMGEIFISDINEELINVYEIIRDDVKKLMDSLERHKKAHIKLGKDFYLKVRAKNPNKMTKLSRASRFIYLNKTCFNGLYRVNSKGKFNVPMGKYTNPGIYQKEVLIEISKLLEKINIKHQVFENVLKDAKKGDFIYFDPPYDPLKKESFTTYTKNKFLNEEQEKLCNVFKELDKRGCFVMHSNNNTDFIKKLYKGYKFKLVDAKRNINSKAEGRGKIKEVVIMNY